MNLAVFREKKESLLGMRKELDHPFTSVPVFLSLERCDLVKGVRSKGSTGSQIDYFLFRKTLYAWNSVWKNSIFNFPGGQVFYIFCVILQRRKKPTESPANVCQIEGNAISQL